MSKVLFVFTSCVKTLTGIPTGWYLPEAAHPYYKLSSAVEIDFASPQGADPQVDPGSVQAFKDEESVKFLNDPTVKGKLNSAKKLSEVKVEEYAAIFYIGGHGPVIDLPVDPDNIKLAGEFLASNKIVSAVCHGPAALVGVTDASGQSIFSGKKATGFSNSEEESIGKVKEIPFLIEDRIKELGGTYEKAAEPWGVKVIVDGKLITGQNPASAAPLGEALLKALKG